MTSPHKISISSEQKRIEELEEALRKISENAGPQHPNGGDQWIEGDLTGDDLGSYKRREAFWECAQIARAALSNTQPKGE